MKNNGDQFRFRTGTAVHRVAAPQRTRIKKLGDTSTRIAAAAYKDMSATLASPLLHTAAAGQPASTRASARLASSYTYEYIRTLLLRPYHSTGFGIEYGRYPLKLVMDHRPGLMDHKRND